jgi:soluble lytic murein transglycosylase-like protein
VPALLAVLFFATPVSAQIYSWRDADGRLVLSNRQKPDNGEVRAYDVPHAATLRTTRATDRTIATTSARPDAFDQLIAEHAQRYGIREDLVRAVVQVESSFNPYARSPKGALGLMQLMPATIRRFGVANPFDAAENVKAGVLYLRELLDRYGNDEQLALAAYNAGEGAVEKYGQRVPPYAETQHYVSAVTEMAGKPTETGAPHIYKVVDIIDGREVVRYTDRKPAR